MGVKEYFECYDRCVQAECRIERINNIKDYYECQYSCEHLCRDKLF